MSLLQQKGEIFMERLTINGARIVPSSTGSKSIILMATIPERKITAIFWPQDIRKLICEQHSYELAYHSAFGRPCNEDDFKSAKNLEEIIKATLMSGLNDESLNLTQAREILFSLGLPTEEFEL